MIHYMAQPCYPLKNQIIAIFFHSEIKPTTSHYPQFNDRYSPQYDRSSFSLYYMTNTLFFLPFFTIFHHLSQSHGCSNPMDASIPHSTDRILVVKSPSFLSQSLDLGCVRAQVIMFLGRFLV